MYMTVHEIGKVDFDKIRRQIASLKTAIFG